MATNFVQPGEVVTLTAPYQRNAGQAAKIGTIIGVAVSTIASGARGEFALTGVWTLTKATGAAWTEGALIYWDDTARNCTTTSTSNTRIGVAAAAAASGDTTGVVRLNGMGAPTGA